MLTTRLADEVLDIYVPETCTPPGEWTEGQQDTHGHFKVHKMPVFRVIPNHDLMAPFFNALEKMFLE